MPLLAGEDIESRLDRQGQIGVVDTLRIASQVCRALETAHGYVTPDGKPKSIVHRDIKPANVFLVRNNGDSEVVKVLDFGIAKMEGTSPLTQSGTAMGTPYYMSPEQARGQEIDARADVYGLGAVMYHMLTGKLPFGDRESESPFTILSRVTNEALPPFADIGITHVPPEVEAIVTKCMKKHPDDRFQSAGELRAAIDATLASLEAEPRPPALPGAVNPIQLSLLPQAASPQQPVLGLSLPAANAPQLGLGSLQPHITERGFRKLGGVAPPHSDIITFEPTLSNIPAQPQITKPVTPPQKPRRRGLRYAVAVATVITLGAAAGLGWHLSRDPPQPTHVSQPARDKSSGQPQPIKQQPLQESIRTPPEKAPPAGELELVSAGPNTPPPVPLDSNAGSRSASAPETPINEPQEGRSTPEESRRHGKGRSKLRPEEDVALRPTLVPEDVELHPSKTP
jgi:serine/threonine-protein kinase